MREQVQVARTVIVYGMSMGGGASRPDLFGGQNKTRFAEFSTAHLDYDSRQFQEAQPTSFAESARWTGNARQDSNPHCV